MSVDHKELDALAAAMNRSAARLQTLWFTFLAVTLYFAISAFTTTHRMLLLEEGQTLPVLDVKLPLLPFYIIAPAFYVVLHAYILMMLVLLARTAKTFEDALTAPGVMIESDRERYRMRLENAIFLQIIVGASRERSGANGLALRTIALISLAVAPVLLLLLFQLMFLPYHSEAITWWHRFLVFADLVLVWTLWPSYRYSWGARMLPRLTPLSQLVIRTALSFAVLVFSILSATFPSEAIHESRVATMADAVLFGELPPRHPFPGTRGRFPNRLWLPNEDFVDDEKLRRLLADNTAHGETRPAYTVVLAERNLVAANLGRTDLRFADFGEARMAESNLAGAWLAGASFKSADLRAAQLDYAELQGSNFVEAKMQGANLARARLYAANLSSARLQGATLVGTQLQGAQLAYAWLQVANLDEAQLQGANLGSARLAGATLRDANLQGASLRETSLWRVRGRPKSVAPAVLLGPIDQLVCSDSPKNDQCKNDVLEGMPRWLRSDAENRWQIANADEPPSDALSRDFWDEAQRASWGGSALADALLQTMCAARGAPHVFRQVIRGVAMHHLPPYEVGRIKSVLKDAAKLKADQETQCPGARVLADHDIAFLDSWPPMR